MKPRAVGSAIFEGAGNLEINFAIAKFESLQNRYAARPGLRFDHFQSRLAVMGRGFRTTIFQLDLLQVTERDLGCGESHSGD
jgi:hypothetical protein